MAWAAAAAPRPVCRNRRINSRRIPRRSAAAPFGAAAADGVKGQGPGALARAAGARSASKRYTGPHVGIPSALTVIGGGLAGTEAGLDGGPVGVPVRLLEMRPEVGTGAHRSGDLAELVCSNSLGSDLPDRAGGLLKAELRRLGSFLLEVARQTAVPAGGALAVDREAFAAAATAAIRRHPLIEVVREEARALPDGPTIVATGPLTSAAFAEPIAEITGREYLYFYDALAPIVEADSIDMGVAFRASRWGKGEREAGDYINCPLNREEYEALVAALVAAERIELADFEREHEHFSRAACRWR